MLDFIRDQYRHGKPILALDAGEQVVDRAGLPRQLPDGTNDPGLIVAGSSALAAALGAFEAVLADHRVYARETDPPRV
jgi:catalase